MAKSNTKVNTANPLLPVRSTLVAPILPEPIVLGSVVFANLLLKPAAKKLEQKNGIYLYKDRLLLEGISMLPNKPHPIIIQNHLNSFLDPSIHFDVAGG